MTAPHGVAIEVRGLRRCYDAQEVLRGIDLDVSPGETLVVIGGSGHGKSVLLRHLAGLEWADSGYVRIGGVDLRSYQALRPEEKPFRMAMVFQGAALLNSLSVEENVALRLRENERLPEPEIRDIVAGSLAAVGLAGTEGKLPGELSGGMRKRVAIARALAARPQVVFHDEPTADLDPLLTRQIGELILRIRDHQGATQVVVTHNLALAAEIGDRIAVLCSGRIVEIVTPGELERATHPYTRAFVEAACLPAARGTAG